MSQDKKPDEKGKPAQFSMQDVVTKSYKSYVNRLKSGAKSGISHAFGNAADIFGGADELPLPQKIDLASFQPRDDEQLSECFVNLAKFTARGSRQFLDKHVQNARDGLFDSEAKKLAGGSTGERFVAALKLLTCTNIHLNVLEQIDPASTADWVKELAYLSMCYSDKLSAHPPLPEIIRSFSTDRQSVCKAMAAKVGRALGFGDIGDAAWNAVLSYLRESSDWRRETLRKAISQSTSHGAVASPAPDPAMASADTSASATAAADHETLATDSTPAQAFDDDEGTGRTKISFKASDGSLLWDVQFAGDIVENVTMASGIIIYKTKEEDKNVIMYGSPAGGGPPEMEIIGPVQVDPRAGNIIFDSLDGLHTVVFLNNGYRIDKHFDGEIERAYLTAPNKSGADEIREELNMATGESLAASPRIDFSDENARLAIRFAQAL